MLFYNGPAPPEGGYIATVTKADRNEKNRIIAMYGQVVTPKEYEGAPVIVYLNYSRKRSAEWLAGIEAINQSNAGLYFDDPMFYESLQGVRIGVIISRQVFFNPFTYRQTGAFSTCRLDFLTSTDRVACGNYDIPRLCTDPAERLEAWNKGNYWRFFDEYVTEYNKACPDMGADAKEWLDFRDKYRTMATIKDYIQRRAQGESINLKAFFTRC